MGSKNKTRISRGFKESNYSTLVLMTNNDYFIFPTGDSDQHYLFSIEPLSSESNPLKKKEENIDKNNINNSYIFFQTSLLYSYWDGSRRIRIHNLCLPITSNIRYIFKKVNSELLASYYLKDSISKIYKTKSISNSIISIDEKFKYFINKVMSIQQRMNKEILTNLSYLPLYILGIFKHRIFCKEEIEKNYDLDISNYLRFSLPKLNYIIYPSIYSLHEFEYNKELGTYGSITGEFNIPSVISSSKNSMEENGLYLIDNGYLLIIYIRKILVNIY